MRRFGRISFQRGIQFGTWTVPVALLALNILTYGLLVPSLGLYQDDLYQAWFLKAFGPRVFIPFFAHERPLFGYTLVLTSAILGYSPVSWHIFALLTRWLAAVALWWSLKQVWPQKLNAITWTAFLFSVYPGFQQHYVAMIYGHFYLYLSSLLLSFGLSVRAVRDRKNSSLYTLFGLLTAALGLIPLEFYFGMEIIRPLFFWFVMEEDETPWQRRFRKVIKVWIPYFVLWIGFLIWRIFVFKFQTYQPVLVNRILSNPVGTVLRLIQTILWDFAESVFLVWDSTWHAFTLAEDLSLRVWVSLALAAAISFCVLIYLNNLREDIGFQEWSWYKPALWIGGLSVLWAGIPFWFVGLNVELSMPYDRVMLPFMFSASLIWVGLIEWLTHGRLQKIILISILVGLASGFQLRLANSYRLVYEDQKSRFAQLMWRIPGLKPGTMILSNPGKSFMEGDNAATAAINWLYDRNPIYPELNYVWLNIPDRLGVTLPSLDPGQSIQKPFRSLLFQGSTDDAITVYSSQPNCLRIIDPEIDSRFDEYPLYIRRAVNLSNLERVDFRVDPEVREAYEELFGPPVEGGWCYYFQKADLALQMKDWTEAARLGDLALTLPEKEQGQKEWLVYIEAYLRTSQWSKAFILSRRAYKERPMLADMICGVWERANPDFTPDSEKAQTAQQLLYELGCARD